MNTAHLLPRGSAALPLSSSRGWGGTIPVTRRGLRVCIPVELGRAAASVARSFSHVLDSREPALHRWSCAEALVTETGIVPAVLSAARERCSDGRKVPTAAIHEGVTKRPALNLPLFGGPSTSVLFGKGVAQAERRERRMGHLSAAQYPYEMFGASCGHCATARRFAAALYLLGMVPGRIAPRGHAETSPFHISTGFLGACGSLAFLLSPRLPGLRAPAFFCELCDAEIARS